MSRIADKIFRLTPRRSIILEFAFGAFPLVLIPTLIYFPPGSQGRLGPGICHDFTLAWLRFGITFRIE